MSFQRLNFLLEGNTYKALEQFIRDVACKVILLNQVRLLTITFYQQSLQLELC